MQVKAAVLYEPNTPLQVEQDTLDEPHAHEVLVRLVATGVCHSDLHCVEGRSTLCAEWMEGSPLTS
jgi:S-(hydroxymethyl)glutathione dehydrogenase / alcohol dehydrogenase